MSAPAAAVLSSSRDCPKAESRAHFCAAEANVFWCALVSFIIVFAPAWWPLLKPPPKIPGPFLHPEMWQQLPLVGKEKLSHNARRFRCLLYQSLSCIAVPRLLLVSDKSLRIASTAIGAGAASAAHHRQDLRRNLPPP